MLGDLSDLGGPTRVLPPVFGSPLIQGGGAITTPLTVDQRGSDRPLGGTPDIGAVEIGFQPDARIGRQSNPNTHLVDNFYSLTASRQTRILRIKKRRTGRIFFSVQNDGDITEDPSVKGNKPHRSLQVQVHRISGDTGNVTGAIRAGYRIADLDPGQFAVFRVDVRARSRSKRSRGQLLYRATSGGSNASDAVRIRVKHKPVRK
jgi:hypothetical protein